MLSEREHAPDGVLHSEPEVPGLPVVKLVVELGAEQAIVAQSFEEVPGLLPGVELS